MNPLRLFSLLSILLITSCVSKKKMVELTAIHQQQEASLMDSIALLQLDMAIQSDTMTRLNLVLSEKKGEINVLWALRDELNERIDGLETAIETNSNQSLSTQESYSSQLAGKEKEIKSLKSRIQDIDQVLTKYASRLKSLSNDLYYELQSTGDEHYGVQTLKEKVVLTISANNLLFKRSNSTSLSESGLLLLEKISQVFQKYPDMDVMVVGHTDIKPPSKSYKDNWYFSTLRAVSVVRNMTQEFGVNNNQVHAAGKAEFSPIASNETSEGRDENRRIEFIIKPLSLNIQRDIQKLTRIE